MLSDLENIDSGTHLDVFSALMQDGDFLGEIWGQQWFLKNTDYALNEIVNLHGYISMINDIFVRDSLLTGYTEILQIISRSGVERMSVGEDSLLMDHLVFTGIIKKIIPIFYSFQGYQVNNPSSISKQIQRRINDVPVHMAYCMSRLNLRGESQKELENMMFQTAKERFGANNGILFAQNYYNYLKLLSVKQL